MCLLAKSGLGWVPVCLLVKSGLGWVPEGWAVVDNEIHIHFLSIPPLSVAV